LTGGIALGAFAPSRFDRAAVALAVGIPALSLAAAALGVLGADPQPGSRRRLSGETAATLAALVIVLGAAAAAPLREHVMLLSFLAGLSAALWQRARAHVPWPLDPAGRGARPLDAADGLKALVLYSVLQVLLPRSLDGFTLGGWRLTPGVIQTVSAPLAGAMALGLTIDPLVKQGLPLAAILSFRGRGQNQARVFTSAVALGVFAFAVILAHNALLDWCLGGSRPRDWQHPATALLRDNPIFAVTAVVVGPAVEEIIFRGLLQQGLRSTLGVRPSLWLATAGFAMMHQPQHWSTVLAAGLCLAWFFERTRHLGAVILAHGVINGLHVVRMLLM
jgi:membrane protease YdiL (CAAX protease family)